MKKIFLFSVVIAQLFSAGYSPDYGPAEQWTVNGTTLQGFIIFDDITFNGEPVESGIFDDSSTGSCPDENCDILAMMYNGICVGWSYLPVNLGQITIIVELNDNVTDAAVNYPSVVPGVYEPVVSFNFYDSSNEIIYYNVNSIQPVAMGMVNGGNLNITGDGNAESSNGFLLGEPTVHSFPPACNTLNGPEGPYDNFDALTGGSGDPSLCGYAGCMDETADNFDSEAVIDEGCIYSGCIDETAVNFDETANSDDGSCGFVGCNDPTAGNTVENGENYSGQLYDCSGNPGIFDLSCCQYWGCNDTDATNYFFTDSNLDCIGAPNGSNESCCTYAPNDISINSQIFKI